MVSTRLPSWFEVIGLLIGLSALAVVIEVFPFSTL
jgi:hypothetical protein